MTPVSTIYRGLSMVGSIASSNQSLSIAPQAVIEALTISCLAGAFVHDRCGLSITANAHSRVTDVYRSRGSGLGVVMVPMMMMVVVTVAVGVLAHWNMLLGMIVLAWLSAETHRGRRLPVLVVPFDCGCCDGHVD
jgi:hypothetical protein